ncbi:MAG TPA: hypothetical protein EYM49_03260 [Campylobacterales bacterium]|nr:hypothetical protein [Campylobacterales bacterium]
MTKKIYLLSISLFFTSCDNTTVVQDESTQDNIAQIVKELKSGVSNKEDQNISTATIEKTIFQEMGIEFSDEKLIIDINKTNNFFGTLEKRLENRVEKQIKKIEQIDINITRDMGIDIQNEEIKIDLNKTKNMLDNISHIFETILFDSNSSKF